MWKRMYLIFTDAQMASSIQCVIVRFEKRVLSHLWIQSGVRFGSAEIYGVVESEKFSYVADSVVVGQRRPGKDDDERVILFVKCRPKLGPLNESRKNDLAQAIRSAYSARHVPAFIFEVSIMYLPYSYIADFFWQR